MTEQKIPVAFFWSGGKDSALALYRLQHDSRYDVRLLVTTINAELRRVSMHGIPETLVEAQAAAIQLPLQKMYFSGSTNDDYERQFAAVLQDLNTQGIRHIAFGDIFLEDLKTYRDRLLAEQGMSGIYPIWKEEPQELLKEFFAAGFRTIICCADAQKLGEAWAGRELDAAAVNELPPDVDPCGENGEFHTFCFSGPIFHTAIKFQRGENVLKTFPIKNAAGEETEAGFWYADLQAVE